LKPRIVEAGKEKRKTNDEVYGLNPRLVLQQEYLKEVSVACSMRPWSCGIYVQEKCSIESPKKLQRMRESTFVQYAHQSSLIMLMVYP
jgi:hypothetical protein